MRPLRPPIPRRDGDVTGLFETGQRPQHQGVLDPEGPGEGAAVARQIEIQGGQKACRQGIEAGMGRRHPVEGGDERCLVERRAHAAARA